MMYCLNCIIFLFSVKSSCDDVICLNCVLSIKASCNDVCLDCIF